MLRSILIIILFVIIPIIVSFCLFNKNKTTLINKTENTQFNDFEISDIKQCKTDEGFKAICATVKNTTDRDYRNVQIQINLLDNSGNLVGNSTATINNLSKRQNWKLAAVVFNKDASVFQIKNIIAVN